MSAMYGVIMTVAIAAMAFGVVVNLVMLAKGTHHLLKGLGLAAAAYKRGKNEDADDVRWSDLESDPKADNASASVGALAAMAIAAFSAAPMRNYNDDSFASWAHE